MSARIRYPFPDIPAEGEAVQVADGVLWMRLPLPMALDHVNVYALDDGDGWTVIDTGFDTRKTRAIWGKLLDGPLAAKPVTRIIGTHHHPDHIGLAGWFQEAGADLAMPRTAWLMARMLTLDEQPAYPARSIDFYRRAGMSADMLAKRQTERPFNFADCVHPMPLGFTRLQEGGVITMGGRTWDIHMGNGHAPEHATFWSRDDNLVIGGDQLLPSISPNIGVYPTEPDADPLAEWLEACERLAPFAREDHLVLGGHKLPFTGLPTRMRQLIDNHHGALKRLLEFIATPKRAGDCFAPLFKRTIDEGTYGLALVEALAHLNHLHQTGQATRKRGEDGAYLFQAA
ncbi:MBL fold metallo-hydrolase [Pseudooctadecabacter jejudonensis]|uniref:Metallo-beta-lactamase superfamily protein n=1 Tax=Pseudooctadecabacter jejudonensis TaxID=1391910 RepID=A0A1Y5T179_9RHOB|nr:MBL fold metallo-hydrolase [Pseudooctadecabacter jejudonensis]SLN53563.1 Metallo-beta-lactamase superfamily protein [Pseudooctadecabacter jejudonensis]